MAVMSFAHLKKKRVEKPVESVVAAQDKQEPAPGPSKVMSFAHLKRKRTQPAPSPVIIEDEITQEWARKLQSARGIGITKTAFIASVNYCEGCPRFWSADENEKSMGVEYGRCMRSSDNGIETWRIIPEKARVAQCWYQRQEKEIDTNLYGPSPCKSQNWKIEGENSENY